jgi:maltooligosyltrehalose trehalohydrolase
MKSWHRMPFGAQCESRGEVRFRLWAPRAEHIEVRLAGEGVDRSREHFDAAIPMRRLEQGWFELVTGQAQAGSQYWFQIDGRVAVPDPASRFQPQDVHGPSQVVDPSAFDWQEGNWKGRPWRDAVIYELHTGTFTPQGTFAALERKLDYLAALGVTAVELMPLADFPGTRNWGYDGVLPFSPHGGYGRPDDLKRLIQSAHARGIMMFLDVVYNHFGPEGNYLREYSPEFFTERHHTPWGEAINFDGPDSRVVRDFFIHNALYWLTEYHFDGLRFDAVHAIVDDSTPDLLTELGQTVRRELGWERHVHLILENDNNTARYLQRDRDQSVALYTAQWNDDFHHALAVTLTGEQDGYYADYADCPIAHLGRCLAEGFSYQGQSSGFRDGKPRGQPSRALPPAAFVSFLQNHDQVGNRAFGERIGKLVDGPILRTAMSIVLLSPSPPLLFMGEEFGADTPFLFFCDFGPELAAAVTQGRRREFARFSQFRDQDDLARIPDPNGESTFARSKLDWDSLSRPGHQEWLESYRQLLEIRRRDIVPVLDSIASGRGAFEMLGKRGLLVRWNFTGGGGLSLLTNLGDEGMKQTEKPEGRLLYASHATQDGQDLPAWFAAWYLHQGSI